MLKWALSLVLLASPALAYQGGGLRGHNHSGPTDGGSLSNLTVTGSLTLGSNPSTTTIRSSTTFEGNIVALSTITVGSSIYTTTTNYSSVIMNGWSLVASTASSKATSVGFQGFNNTNNNQWAHTIVLRGKIVTGANTALTLRINGPTDTESITNCYSQGNSSHSFLQANSASLPITDTLKGMASGGEFFAKFTFYQPVSGQASIIGNGYTVYQGNTQETYCYISSDSGGPGVLQTLTFESGGTAFSGKSYVYAYPVLNE